MKAKTVAKMLRRSDYGSMTLSIARLALLFVLLSSISAAALDLDSAYLATIREGINLTMVERFAEAKEVFQGLIERDSTDCAAFLFLAGVYHGEMIDREDYTNKPIFYQLIDKALAHAERAIEQNRNPAWAHLTRGNAYSYIAVIEAKNGSWWSALKGGLRAKGEYLKALERDPMLYDAYLGLGSYHYWKSAKTEFINWLPFVPDRKEEAFKELQLAVDSSLFSSDLALNSLVWIHLDGGRPEQALEIANRLRERFPESRLVTWGLALSAYRCGQFAQAADYFGKILEAIEKQPGQNYYNTIECRYHRACIFRTLKDNDRAIKELEALLGCPVSDEIRDRQKEKLRRAREMVDQLRKQR